MPQAHNPNAYMMRHLRQIPCVKWWHRFPNEDILQKTNMPSMHETLVQRNLRWADHLVRLDNTRLPKQILYCQLKEENQSIGRLKLPLQRYCHKEPVTERDPTWELGQNSQKQITLERTNTKEVIIGYDGQRIIITSRRYTFSVFAEAGGMYITRDDGVFAANGGFSCAILRCRSRPNNVIGKIGDFGC